MGLTRENLMACGDGLNDRSMISYAGVGEMCIRDRLRAEGERPEP